jgi:hypothetical protein
MSTGLLLDGVFASEHIDSSGEILDIEGLDITDFDEGKGTANYEHVGAGDGAAGNGQEIVGKIIYAHKIMKESDCKNDREKMFWEKVRLPFLYGVVRFYDGAGHEGAKALAAIVRDSHANEESILVAFSIEGSTLRRNAKTNRLESTVARKVALTLRPCNKMAVSGLLADPNAPEGYDKQPVAPDLLAMVPISRQKTNKKEDLDPRFQRLGGSEAVYGPEITKAMTAGSYGGAPGTLTGGAALQVEDRTLKAQFLAAYRDWNRVTPFKKFLKARLPEVSDEYLDHYADVVDRHIYRIKKAAEFLTDLRKAGKLKSPKKTGVAARPSIKIPEPEAPLTLGGKALQPNPGMKTHFDEDTGTLHTPRGSLPMYIPSRDADHGESFRKIMADPKISQFHDYAMENWSRAHKLLKAKQLPPEVAMHSVLFSNLSPNTPVPTQEHMYSHLVDSMKAVGKDFRDPEGLETLRTDWLSRDNPHKWPEHSPEHFKRLEENLRLGSDSKTTNRKKGDIGSFMLTNNKFKNMAQYHGLHQGLMDLLSRHGADGRSAADEMMTHKARAELHEAARERASKKGAPDPGPYNQGPVFPGLAPKTARYALGMMGAGNVHVPDTHFARYLFGLDKEKDGGPKGTIPYIKNLLWNPNNSHVLSAVDRYYAQHHDAVKHMTEHPRWGQTFANSEDAVFPSFWKNWMAIVPHEAQRGMTTGGFNEYTDHRPFWEAVAPYLNKNESAESLPIQTARQHAQWALQYGAMPAQMLYFRYLLPQLLDAGARRSCQELVSKTEELGVELRLRKDSTEIQRPPEPQVVEFQGKPIRPGKANYNGQTVRLLHSSPTEFVAVPAEKIDHWTPEDLFKIPKNTSESNLLVSGHPEDLSIKGVVDSRSHGVHILHDDVHNLVHGLDFNQAQVPGKGGSRPAWWGKSADGRGVYVKKNWVSEAFPETHREAVYHNVARDYFGLGKHLPRVAAIRQPQSGEDHVVTEVVGGQHFDAKDGSHQEALNNLAATGDLDKLQSMDYVLGNDDRNRLNWLLQAGDKPDLKLIDHGLTFADPHHSSLPSYQQHTDANRAFHPETLKWVQSLSAPELDQQLRRHEVPEAEIQGALNRLKTLQSHLRGRPDSSVRDAWVMPSRLAPLAARTPEEK